MFNAVPATCLLPSFSSRWPSPILALLIFLSSFAIAYQLLACEKIHKANQQGCIAIIRLEVLLSGACLSHAVPALTKLGSVLKNLSEMTIRVLSSKANILRSFFGPLTLQKRCGFFYCSFSFQTPQTSEPLSQDLVNEISRVLSDHRNPQHDLELSLKSFSAQISASLVEQVLKRCKNLGFPAHRFFLWAKSITGFRHSIESYHILVEILGSNKQFAMLWDFLIELRESNGCEIKSEIFWLVFRAYSRANLPGGAIHAFARMEEFGIKPNIQDFDKLLHVLCKRKHVKHAQQFFDQAKSHFELNVKTYSILIRGWGDIGESTMAHELFNEMLKKGFSLDVPAYNSLLDALCKGGNLDEATKLFQDMGSNRVEPDAYTYSIFIHAFCNANEIYLAFKVLDRMRRYNLLPNVFTYNCIIKRLCKNEKVEEAYNLLDEMIARGVSPDSWSYNAIQAYHCDHSEVNRALRLMARMENDNCLPDRHTYNMVLKLLIRIGKFDKATEVWESMDDKGFYPSVSTYAVMVHGFCKKKGKLKEACKYFEMMIDEGIPPYICTIEMLRNRLFGLGFSEHTEVLADKMRQSTSCSIQEQANVMMGTRARGTLRCDVTDLESD